MKVVDMYQIYSGEGQQGKMRIIRSQNPEKLSLFPNPMGLQFTSITHYHV